MFCIAYCRLLGTAVVETCTIDFLKYRRRQYSQSPPTASTSNARGREGHNQSPRGTGAMGDSTSLLPSASMMSGDGSTSSEAAQQAAFLAELYTLDCRAGFIVVGLQDGEAVATPIRVICTLITISVGSAWISRRRSIKKLLLFFSHWLS